ncbi:MAG: hypothetical protein WCI29_07815 [Actinomycetes bacterium]
MSVRFTRSATHFATRLAARLQVRLMEERGDVPGWVLVAVMTAGLVTALWLVADTQLTGVLNRAISSVTKP